MNALRGGRCDANLLWIKGQLRETLVLEEFELDVNRLWCASVEEEDGGTFRNEAGGVSTEDVTPKTLESRIVPGLYFAGEVLDVDGRCGGYNLQWAFATGYIAGLAAAHYCRV